MLKKKLLLSSLTLALLLTSCNNVTVPDVKLCTVAGIIQGGADCNTTFSHVPSEMSQKELLEFLEPKYESIDPKDPKKKIPGRAGAILISADDWTKVAIFFEQACRALGSRCTPEMLEKIANVKDVADKLKFARTNNIKKEAK